MQELFLGSLTMGTEFRSLGDAPRVLSVKARVAGDRGGWMGSFLTVAIATLSRLGPVMPG